MFVTTGEENPLFNQNIIYYIFNMSDFLKKNTTLVVIVSIILVVCSLCGMCTFISSLGNSNRSTNQLSTKKDTDKDLNIVKTETHRFDKAPSYYVLVSPMDYSNADFKIDVKVLVKKIVQEKGMKVSINIFDNEEALDLYYKSQYGTNSLGRILDKNELNLLASHNIASFDGELDTYIYPNSLSFFPSSNKDNKINGKYFEIVEFNPLDYVAPTPTPTPDPNNSKHD